MIKGVNRDSLKHIIGQIRRRTVDSIEDFQKTASILGAYDQFSDPTEELANDFIRNNQGISHSNLSTKQILEDVINGTDFTSLMSVEKEGFGNRLRYEWETNNSYHADVLHELREITNSMRRKLDMPFIETEEYELMKRVAQRCYDESQGLFRFWERIVDTKPSDIVASAPLDLAQEIFAYVKEEYSKGNILQGVRAIIYIDQKNPHQGIDKIARNFASYFVDNIPEGTRKSVRLRNTLNEARAYTGAEAIA